MKEESINNLRALRAQTRMELDYLCNMSQRLTGMIDIITEILEEECQDGK